MYFNFLFITKLFLEIQKEKLNEVPRGADKFHVSCNIIYIEVQVQFRQNYKKQSDKLYSDKCPKMNLVQFS